MICIEKLTAFGDPGMNGSSVQGLVGELLRLGPENALGPMKTTKATTVISMALMACNLENVLRCHVQVSTTNRIETLSILKYLRTLQSFKHILFKN